MEYSILLLNALNIYVKKTKQRKTPASVINDRYSIGKIFNYFKDRHLIYINDVTEEDIEKLPENKRKEGLSKVTLNNHIGFLRKIFNKLMKKGILSENPAEMVEFYQIPYLSAHALLFSL